MNESLLVKAERLERDGALARADYYAALDATPRSGGRILDVGCGNGYAVLEWRRRGRRAIGVDNSRYRFGQIVREHFDRPFVLADVTRLPFRAGSFGTVIASGMIEHVGVVEYTDPYRVERLQTCEGQRLAAIREMLRVTSPEGGLFVDCPNGAFPVDFWHGGQLGAFRVHPVPDPLSPVPRDFSRWAASSASRATILPIVGRLRFRQIATRWWGRLLSLPVAAGLRFLDWTVRHGRPALAERLYPYLVVGFTPVSASPMSGPLPTANALREPT